MSLTQRLEPPLMAAANAVFAALPQPRPSAERLANVRIFSHRGERDGDRVKENTFAAFDPLIDSGVFGIEFDIRWTADFEPVVFHDPDAQRVWGSDLILEQTPLAKLRQELPEVPTLAEMVERYAKRFHLMIEFKQETYRDPPRQLRRLAEILAPLTPGEHYTACSFDIDLLESFAFIPAHAKLAIAHMSLKPISDAVLQLGYGGIGAHLLFMDRPAIARHQAAGQRVSVGFPESRNGLFREINRGIDWIFSNQAIRMSKMALEEQTA